MNKIEERDEPDLWAEQAFDLMKKHADRSRMCQTIQMTEETPLPVRPFGTMLTRKEDETRMKIGLCLIFLLPGLCFLWGGMEQLCRGSRVKRKPAAIILGSLAVIACCLYGLAIGI